MPRIQPVNRNEIGADTLSLLNAISGGDGSRWNVFEGIARHPPTLRAMAELRKAVDADLSTLEQEVIAIEIARFNGCGYCLPAHRYVCHEIGIGQVEVDAMTRGELLFEHPDIALIQQFVRAALEMKGHLEDAQFLEFKSGGIDDGKMIVILAEIALYTLLNYFNRLAGSEIEPQVLPFVSDQADWITTPDR